MNKTLILKELHDLRVILAFAGIGALFLVPSLFGLPLTSTVLGFIGTQAGFLDNSVQNPSSYPPFSRNGYIWYVEFGILLLALILGFAQGLHENRANRWHFLLSLPISRKEVLLAKMIVGFGTLLVFTLFLVGAGVLYSTIPGRVPFPLEWWIVLDASQWLPFGMVLYFASLFCGLRRARWLGTRLVPLFGAFVLFWAVTSIGIEFQSSITGLQYRDTNMSHFIGGFFVSFLISTFVSIITIAATFDYFKSANLK